LSIVPNPALQERNHHHRTRVALFCNS
jgi:hypothetical protein